MVSGLGTQGVMWYAPGSAPLACRTAAEVQRTCTVTGLFGKCYMCVMGSDDACARCVGEWVRMLESLDIYLGRAAAPRCVVAAARPCRVCIVHACK